MSSVFVAPLHVDILEFFKMHYGTENTNQLKNILISALLDLSSKLNLPIYMAENGTIWHCANQDELERIKLYAGEM